MNEEPGNEQAESSRHCRRALRDATGLEGN